MRLCNTKGTTGIIYEIKPVFQIQGPATVSAGSLQHFSVTRCFLL